MNTLNYFIVGATVLILSFIIINYEQQENSKLNIFLINTKSIYTQDINNITYYYYSIDDIKNISELPKPNTNK